MHNWLTRTSLPVLIAVAVATTAGPATAATEPPPISSQLPDPTTWVDWTDFFTGCGPWVRAESGRWEFSCSWQGETWSAHRFYHWDADTDSVVLHRDTYYDWVDMWGWDCFTPGQCHA